MSGSVRPIIMTARRLISALVLKYLNRDRFILGPGRALTFSPQLKFPYKTLEPTNFRLA